MSFEYDCTQPVDIAEEPHHHLVIANEYVRVFAVEVPPRTRTLCHRHPDEYLLYVAEGAPIVSAARGEEPKSLNYVTGESELSKAGMVHVVENLGGTAFRNIVVELRPRASELRRGQEPKVGRAATERVLNERAGEILAIDMEPGGEAEIAGPAVLASPYKSLIVKEVDEYDIPLDGFRKLLWVCGSRTVSVRNPGHETVRVVVIRVGSEG